jgi:hypothetical protein
MSPLSTTPFNVSLIRTSSSNTNLFVIHHKEDKEKQLLPLCMKFFDYDKIILLRGYIYMKFKLSSVNLCDVNPRFMNDK